MGILLPEESAKDGDESPIGNIFSPMQEVLVDWWDMRDFFFVLFNMSKMRPIICRIHSSH